MANSTADVSMTMSLVLSTRFAAVSLAVSAEGAARGVTPSPTAPNGDERTKAARGMYRHSCNNSRQSAVEPHGQSRTDSGRTFGFRPVLVMITYCSNLRRIRGQAVVYRMSSEFKQPKMLQTMTQ